MNLVNHEWIPFNPTCWFSESRQFAYSLSRVKNIVEWSVERFKNRDMVLKYMEGNLYNHNAIKVFSDHKLLMLVDLESKRVKLLQEREAKWHMKRNIVWLDLGNENTKFFHFFSNHQKNVNTILEL
jgi:hypothetical protein